LRLNEVVENQGLDAHDEAFLRRDRGALLDFLGLDAELSHEGRRVDDMDAFAERLSGDAPEHADDADVPGPNARRGRDGDESPEQDEHQQAEAADGAVTHAASCSRTIAIACFGSVSAFRLC